MNEFGRREFLVTSARIATLITALRLGFAGRSVHAESEMQQPQPEQPLPSELEKTLNKMVILDIGKVKDGQVTALSNEETWKLISGDQKSEEEIRGILDNPDCKDYRSLLVRHFLYYGGHGRKVMDALKQGMSSLTGSKDEIMPEFLALEQVNETDGTIFSISEGKQVITMEGDLNEHGVKQYRFRGMRFSVKIPPPAESVLPDSEKIVSCSFQMGTLQVDVMTEEGTIANKALSFSDVKSLLMGFSESNNTFKRSRSDRPNGSFIFPPGTDEKNIEKILVKELGETTTEYEYTFNTDKWIQMQSSSDPIITVVETQLDESAPMIEVRIQLNDGNIVSGIENPTETDYSYDYKPAKYTMRKGPRIQGAYHPDNPNRQQNLDQLKAFLEAHPNQFFVLALGNYGDELTDEDLAQLPQNGIFFGQLVTIAGYYEAVLDTFGDTMGNVETPYVDTQKLGIEGQGSSFAVPIASFVISWLYRDQDQLPTREGIISKLNELGCLETIEIASSEEISPQVLELDIESLKKIFRAGNKLPAHLSRRGLLLGRIRE